MMKTIHKANLTFGEWLIIANHSEDTKNINIKEMPRPLKVAKHKTPETLDEMTLGQMLEISSAEGSDAILAPCRVLLGMSDAEVMKARAIDVVPFTGWVTKELEKISLLFESVRNKPTPEEVAAGVSKLNHGVFGLVDWYAKRMGITNHDEVLQVCWQRVFKCLQIDNENAAFQRRLQDVYTQKAKIKKR